MTASTVVIAAGPLRDTLTVALGVVSGVLSGAFGVGGAVISTPGIRLLGASAFVAVGTTLPSIVPGAVIATVRYRREGLISWRVLAVAGPAGMIGAIGGSLSSHAVPGEGHWLMVLTAVLLASTAWRMARSTPTAADDAHAATPPAPPRPRSPVVAAIGLAAGLLSGLLGLGGGLVLVPGFCEVLRLPLKKAIATSLACIGLLAVPGTITHAALGDISWRLALLLTIGVVPGARVGAAIAIAANDRRLRLTVALGLAVVAVLYGGGELAAL